MTDKEFDQLCDQHGFGGLELSLRQHLLPCVGFSLRADAAQHAKSSRLGGAPAVPKSFQWPKYNNRPLDFLLQVNLQEVNKHDSTGLLPAAGLLAFFYDLEEQPWGYDPKNLSFFRTYYFPSDLELFVALCPERYSTRPALPQMGIEFWPAVSLPTFGSRAWGSLSRQVEKPGAEFDFSAFERLSQAVFRAAAPTPKGPSHRLGGHSDNIQGDMQLEAQLVMNGLYCGSARGYHDPMRPELEKTCEEWRLLLQLDSDESAKLMWGDTGLLYFWARQSDVLRGDFSRTWMTLQCS